MNGEERCYLKVSRWAAFRDGKDQGLDFKYSVIVKYRSFIHVYDITMALYLISNIGCSHRITKTHTGQAHMNKTIF